MKTTFKHDHYFLYNEVKEMIEYFEKNYPEIVSSEVLYTTPKGRNLYAVTISKGDPSTKPAYHIDANTHAGEVTGTQAAMHTLDYLVTNYGEDKEVTKLVDDYTIYIVPRISPDGSEAYLTSCAKLRSVDRPYLTEKQDKGLYNADIDEDGVLRQIRIPTPYGAWKVNPDNPNTMLRRKPDETEGEFYNIYPEGLIEDYDGVHFDPAKPLWGLDFNRNYPFGWYSEVRQPGAGRYPLSNGENKAMADWITDHKNIGGVMTHHTNGGMLLVVPGTRPEKTISKLDQKTLHEMADMCTEEMGYPVVPIFTDFFEDNTEYSSGAFDDFCYQQHGIPAYTMEFWNMREKAGVKTDWPPKKKSDQERAADYQKLIDWIMENSPESFKPWTPFNHPQLGEIEIGGIDMKFTLQNPPVQFLQKEVENCTRFMIRMIKALPMLVIDETEVEHLSGNAYRVNVVVANKGYLPTYLTTETKKLAIEDTVKVTLEDQVVDLGSLEGFSGVATDYFYDESINTFAYPPIRKKASFIVVTDEPKVTVTASCAKAGTVTMDIEL